PAFPTEGRTTVGGYHLLKGIPLERTDVARDPQAPIYESHIPSLLADQLENAEIIGQIELKTVTKGAGPILIKLQELIKENKKLIVIDAVSTVDLEQISLALEKSTCKILPCGSAGLAQVLSKSWLPEMKHQHITKVFPELPILTISGSKTDLAKIQIEKLADTDEFEPYLIELNADNILDEPSEKLVEKVLNYLGVNNKILVYYKSIEEKETALIKEQGVKKEDIPGYITNFLSLLTQKIVSRKEVILVLVGGETSYKCCSAINSKHLQLIDEVVPAIPLCLDHKAQWIVTKSGNLGTPNTLVEIIKYFEQHS
ncbi:MAG: four-carbon acid sugar kinase family protein, partial [Candidatus Gastranaerophilales bacterium]|nr:four-carbon acid sugar kinase family protein [Candidatus Gastranaerophilales bacterium]